MIVRYGNNFVKRFKSYLHAEEESVEYNPKVSLYYSKNPRDNNFRLLISIEVDWLKVETQIGILKRVAAAGQLSKPLQSMQSQILSQLKGKRKTASLIIEQLMTEKREEERSKAKPSPKHAK